MKFLFTTIFLVSKKFIYLNIKSNNEIEINEFISNLNVTMTRNFENLNQKLEPLKASKINIHNLSMSNLFDTKNGGSFSFSPFYEIFINNTLIQKSFSNGNGGAISFESAVDLYFTNLTLKDNTALLAGGSIFSSNTGLLSIQNSSVQNNRAVGTGGSFSITGKDINIENFESKNCTASNSGGVLYSILTGSFTANNIKINKSFSNGHGGTFYVQSTGDFKLNNTLIKDSYSGGYGGTIYSSSSNNVSISNLNVSNSTSTSHGGFAYITSPKSFITTSIFDNNKASSYGGSIHITTSSTNTHEIYDTYFGYCSSLSYGGAIYIGVSSLSTIKIIDCIFYYCNSKHHGGSAYVSSNHLILDIIRVCCSNSFINDASTSYMGAGFFLDGNSNQYLLKLYQLSLHSSGQTGWSYSSLYIEYGEQNINSINFSYNKAHRSSAGYFYPYFSTTIKYCNFVGCLSSSNDALQLRTAGNLFDFEYCNLIANHGNLYCIYYEGPNSKYLYIRYCIFINNAVTSYLLYSYGNYIQHARGCYIVHTGSWNYGFTNDSCNVTSISTSTYIITHHSTYLCYTPNELGGLDISATNCQTIPPIPSTCFFESNNLQISFNLINSLMTFFFLFIL